ncbi:secondary thiamine-phosphate synthase enzyme YjbQ [Roseburia hominis]
MIRMYSYRILTKEYNQMILVTDKLREAVRESGIQNGVATVMTMHTTTGIAVNEALECLESDIANMLEKNAPEEGTYSHARMLHDYGSTAGNPTGHLKSYLTGNHCHFYVIDGELIQGGAQDVYFCEFDGPANRMIKIFIDGE